MEDTVTRNARDLLEAGEDFVIAKVVDTNGSTPRKKGAWCRKRQLASSYSNKYEFRPRSRKLAGACR